MTWGTAKNNEKAPIQAFASQEAGWVGVQGEYPHLPQKPVLAVASMTLITGILCILLGIAHEVLFRDWKLLGVGCGIMFAITGILGIVSVYKRSKGRLVATGVLAIISCIAAASMGIDVVGQFCGRKGRHRRSSSHGSGQRPYSGHKMSRRVMKAVFGINIVFIVFCLLVFCCCVALAVFVLKTVTSPKGREEHRAPVVSLPPPEEPDKMDTFNGN